MIPRIAPFFSQLALLPLALWAGAADPQPLWLNTPPGEIPSVRPDSSPHGRMNDAERLTDVARPTLTWFRPEKPDGRALIVCPGGGYGILAIHKEGEKIAHHFARAGLTVAVLHYRVPVKNVGTADAAPRLDLAEALRQVRADLAAQGFTHPRVGTLGFSAGGHLVLESAYGPMPADARRPDFVVAVYPAYLTAQNGTLKDEFAPTKSSPPACFIHAADDPYPADGSVQLWQRLRHAGVNAELHVYAAGGHGFGFTTADPAKPHTRWPSAVEAWLRTLTP